MNVNVFHVEASRKSIQGLRSIFNYISESLTIDSSLPHNLRSSCSGSSNLRNGLGGVRLFDVTWCFDMTDDSHDRRHATIGIDIVPDGPLPVAEDSIHGECMWSHHSGTQIDWDQQGRTFYVIRKQRP